MSARQVTVAIEDEGYAVTIAIGLGEATAPEAYRRIQNMLAAADTADTAYNAKEDEA